ncbi:MAG TPA: acyl carrier protein [Candidatus Scatovivens faecipullorum]|nr:acyl carrier protein [Candidatus Scatovivens faecipullorum]
MERSEIFEKLNEIFRDVFDDDSITVTDSTSAADIEDWDSLTHITLISEVEEEFGIKFAMKDVIGMQNVGEMVDIIMEDM